MNTPMNYRRRISRADYDLAKANCSAKINVQMQALGLTPSKVQELTNQAVINGEQERSISMQDLHQYRACRALPKDLKLRALAAVLKVHPDDLVPKAWQSGRLLVGSRGTRAANDPGQHVVVVYPDGKEGVLEVKGRLPIEEAYKLRELVAKFFIRYQTMKATGLDVAGAEQYLKDMTNPVGG